LLFAFPFIFFTKIWVTFCCLSVSLRLLSLVCFSVGVGSGAGQVHHWSQSLPTASFFHGIAPTLGFACLEDPFLAFVLQSTPRRILSPCFGQPPPVSPISRFELFSLHPCFVTSASGLGFHHRLYFSMAADDFLLAGARSPMPLDQQRPLDSLAARLHFSLLRPCRQVARTALHSLRFYYRRLRLARSAFANRSLV
jgi:hypothetical protein